MVAEQRQERLVTTFTDNINKLSIYHRDQSTFISEKIMIPLNEVISSHMNSITRAFINNDNNEREFNKILNELVLKQENFHTAAKDLSVAIADNEIAKVNTNIKKSMKNKYMTMQNKKMDVAKTEYQSPICRRIGFKAVLSHFLFFHEFILTVHRLPAVERSQ